MLLGAGRTTVDTPIDYGAGVVLHRKVGDLVEEGSHLPPLYSTTSPSARKRASERPRRSRSAPSHPSRSN